MGLELIHRDGVDARRGRPHGARGLLPVEPRHECLGSMRARRGRGLRMRVLLLAMPDVASSFDRVMRMPNLGLMSLAANVEGAEVRILDLVPRRRATTRRMLQ